MLKDETVRSRSGHYFDDEYSFTSYIYSALLLFESITEKRSFHRESLSIEEELAEWFAELSSSVLNKEELFLERMLEAYNKELHTLVKSYIKELSNKNELTSEEDVFLTFYSLRFR